MLTSSSNQYLRPEYITPLPTTLDSKKSPLALLAQTCSQIGVDPPNGKLPSNTDKYKLSKQSEQSSREKNSPSAPSSTSSSASSESIKSSFKPYDSCLQPRDKTATPEDLHIPNSQQRAASRSRTPGKRCGSNQSASSNRAQTPQSRTSATPNGEHQMRESPASRHTVPEHHSATRASSASSLASENLLRPTSSSSAYTHPSSAATTTTPSAAYLASYMPHLSMDALTSSIMSQQHALKAGLAANPYLNYGRMKTPSGGEALVPLCRDPYCTGCQFSSAPLMNGSPASTKAPPTTSAPGSGACPAGCAQCDHKPYTMYHAQLAALAAASQLPYICNWIGSDAVYCGKRFTNSDELLQHFRTHTGVPESNAAATAAATAAALSLLSPPGLGPTTHPLLSRGYPTPPLSPLAASRYHPYGKPTGLLPPGLSSLGLPLPPGHPHAAAGLPPYFSPYSLYNNARLGATSGMHP